MTLSPKAERTRQHILETALHLFVENGYAATTMREIAENAGYSLGLTYRYFARKEDLVLELYRRMAAELRLQVAALEGGQIADRFLQVMQTYLAAAAVYREALGALFGASMLPSAESGLTSAAAADVRDMLREAFRALVTGAVDVPKAPKDEHLAAVLASLHFILTVCWLYDRSDQQHASSDLLEFVRDMLQVARPALALPFLAQGLARMAGIIEAVLA